MMTKEIAEFTIKLTPQFISWASFSLACGSGASTNSGTQCVFSERLKR